MKYSLCLTNYNRYELLIESFAQVIDDPRIDEIIIVDDCSKMKIYLDVCSYFNRYEKVKIVRNEENIGMSRNKKLAIFCAKNEYVIILDSDNKIGVDYLDALDNIQLFSDTIYMPEAALPNFIFTKFSGLMFGKYNVASWMDDPMFRVCLNACNYVVNRLRYLKTYKFDPTIKATDTINHNYNHLVAGGSFYIVPNLTYQHLVHPESGFMADLDYNMSKAIELENKIRQLN